MRYGNRAWENYGTFIKVILYFVDRASRNDSW